jgi:Glycosyl transferases group 1
MQRHRDLFSGEKVAQRASRDIPADALVITIIVQLEPEKGLDISIESISRMISSLPPSLRNRVHVMIAGDGQLREWLEKEICQRGLSHVCWMMGNISSEEVHSLLAASDISLHTHIRGSSMPMALLEAMAAGCAVVVSTESLAVAHLFAEGRGIVVPEGDVEHTSKALEYLLRETDLRNSMGKAAREYLSLHHGTEAVGKALLQEPHRSDVSKPLEKQTEPLGPVEKAKIPTRVRLQTIPISTSWSSQVMDLDQPTWLLPVTPRSSRVSSQPSPSGTKTPDGESYLRLIRNLVKNSGIYAISSLSAPLVTLLLAPFLTHTLSRTEYGALAVLITAAALVTGVTELGLGAGFMRLHSYDSNTRRVQLDALSTYVMLMLLVLIPIAAIGVMAAPWLSTLVLGSASYSSSMRVAVVLVLSQNLSNPGLVWLRVESRAGLFSMISIANLLITAGATIVLVGT